VFDSIYGGENYDARLEMPGWDRAEFDDSHWKPALEVPAPAGLLTAQSMPPMRVTKVIEPVKPAPLPGAMGVVDSVKEVEQKGENPIAGPIIGGIAGAVLGHQFGEGRGKTVAAAVGAGAGVLGGKVVEQKVRATKHWETTVRLDDGSTQTIKSDAQPAFHAGERVRVVDGLLLKPQG